MDKVTCLCPTYGRFSLMQESLNYFFNQTYEAKKLLILNDAPESFTCDYPNVEVVNVEDRFETLGHKRQALLEMADTPYVAQWDDDDVYLPWHLEMCMSEILDGHMVKPREAYYIRGTRGVRLNWKGTTRNWLEAMTVFDREAANNMGGYTEKVSGQGIRMIKRFKEEGRYNEFNPDPAPSFVFRFAQQGIYHIQGGDKVSHERFAEANTDFGDGKLTPVEVDDYYKMVLNRGQKSAKDLRTFKLLLSSSLS